MTQQEQQMIDTIKAAKGYQVFKGTFNGEHGSVRISHTHERGVWSTSVWLGKRTTIDSLQMVLDRIASH